VSDQHKYDKYDLFTAQLVFVLLYRSVASRRLFLRCWLFHVYTSAHISHFLLLADDNLHTTSNDILRQDMKRDKIKNEKILNVYLTTF